ncbi:hypothetical protein [Ktedonobacter sp. SOSP1-85]|nr:hypothetical protein [Ktedonobacter sp. SOSP1-85]
MATSSPYPTVGKGLAEIPPGRLLAGQSNKQYLAGRLSYTNVGSSI